MFRTVPPSAETVGSTAFHEGLAPIVSRGYINPKGEVAIANSETRVAPFSDGLAAMNGDRDATFGYISRTGEMLIGPETWAGNGSTFEAGFAQVSPTSTRRGLIDRQGAWAVGPMPSEEFGYYACGWRVRRINRKEVIENPSTGKIITLDQVDELGRFSDGVFVATSLDSDEIPTFTIVDATGAITAQFSSVVEGGDVHGRFSEGLMPFWTGIETEFGFINKHGQVQIPPKFQFAYPFREGLAPVGTEDGCAWGYIDQSGQWQISPQEHWLLADCFHEGAAAVLVARNRENNPRWRESYAGDKWGYIDKNGRWLFPPVFSLARPFSEGLAHVEFDFYRGSPASRATDHLVHSGQCYLDQAGTFIWPPELAGQNIHELVKTMPNEREVGRKFQVVIPD